MRDATKLLGGAAVFLAMTGLFVWLTRREPIDLHQHSHDVVTSHGEEVRAAARVSDSIGAIVRVGAEPATTPRLRAVDESELPILGATVFAEEAGRWEAHGITDTEGYAEYPSTASRLHVSADGYAGETLENQSHQPTAMAGVLTVQLVRADRITGRVVVGGDRRPVPRANVAAVSCGRASPGLDSNRFVDDADPTLRIATTNELGEFVVDGLNPNIDYTLIAASGTAISIPVAEPMRCGGSAELTLKFLYGALLRIREDASSGRVFSLVPDIDSGLGIKLVDSTGIRIAAITDVKESRPLNFFGNVRREPSGEYEPIYVLFQEDPSDGRTELNLTVSKPGFRTSDGKLIVRPAIEQFGLYEVLLTKGETRLYDVVVRMSSSGWEMDDDALDGVVGSIELYSASKDRTVRRRCVLRKTEFIVEGIDAGIWEARFKSLDSPLTLRPAGGSVEIGDGHSNVIELLVPPVGAVEFTLRGARTGLLHSRSRVTVGKVTKLGDKDVLLGASERWFEGSRTIIRGMSIGEHHAMFMSPRIENHNDGLVPFRIEAGKTTEVELRVVE